MLMAKDIYNFREYLDNQNVFFCFNGIISQELLVGMSTHLKQSMKNVNVSNTTIFNVFSVIVEQIQNIIQYSIDREQDGSVSPLARGGVAYGQGVIIVGYERGHYYVLCGNMIENMHVERLKSKLVVLQKMNKQELKDYYKVQRRKEPDEYSKGAGLGFIEMARKASEPIEFEFRNIDALYSFFSIKTIL